MRAYKGKTRLSGTLLSSCSSFLKTSIVDRLDRDKTAKPCQQLSQTWAVFLSNPGEFQPHSASTIHMAHNSLGSDLAFFDEKINLCFGSNRLRLRCLNKNSPKTQIPNTGNIATPRATPIHPNPFRNFDARSLSPGIGWQL